MGTDFRTALRNRHSYYDISSQATISDAEIEELVSYAILHTPSAFNSQTARVVMFFGEHHHRYWEIVRDILRGIVPAENFTPTDKKIDGFAAGHGTILFYEDQAVIRELQQQFPTYETAFPGFSMNSSGMLQLVVWVMLRDAGMGASLQHYCNLVEEAVAKAWNLSPDWKLIAEMPYGKPNSEPEAKDQQPLSTRLKIFH